MKRPHPGRRGRHRPQAGRRGSTDEGHEVVGIDRRPWLDAPIEFHEVDVRKRAAEDVFRKVRPQAVVHMATVTSLVVPGEERYQINLGGTRAVFEYCARVRRRALHLRRPAHVLRRGARLAALPHGGRAARSRSIASPSWPISSPPTSTRPPRSGASRSWPPRVLRFCYTLGPSGHGTLASFLRGKRVPMVLGFDPLFQFLHEDDVVRAIVLTLEQAAAGRLQRGRARSRCRSRAWSARPGARRCPLPEFVLAGLLGRFGLPQAARGRARRTSSTRSSWTRARSATRRASQHEHDEIETIRSFREAVPPPL